MRRALVTGASSYLGGRLCRRLLDEGWAVTATVHRAALAADLAARPGLAVAPVDEGQATWDAALAQARPEVVLHVAARAGPEPAGGAVRDQLRANLETGVLLLEAMRAQGCRRLVSTGTFWQYGDGTDPRPTCFYAVAKSAFELFIDHAVAAHGLSACTLVLYDVYGEDDPRTKLFRLLFEAARSGTAVDLTPGEQLVDLVHMDDVVEAYRVAMERTAGAGAPRHERFAVSGGAPASLRALVGQFEQALGRPVPVRWGGRPYRLREVMHPGVGPALPGWAPRVAPAQGLARVARAWQVGEAGA